MINAGNFGWTYFDFVDPKGEYLNVVVHDTDIFGLSNEPYMTIGAKKEGSPVYRNKGKINKEWHLPTKEKLGSFKFLFPDCQLIGEIKPLDIDKQLTGIKLYDNTQNGKESWWSVDLPWGKYKAELQRKGEKAIKLEGFAYQDRQWGNVCIQEWVSNWNWGHLSTENGYIIFFYINGFNKEKAYYSLSRDKDKTIANNRSSQFLDIQNCKASVFNGGVESFANFMIEDGKMMRSRANENYKDFNASYFRYGINGKCGKKQEDGWGIYERISLDLNI